MDYAGLSTPLLFQSKLLCLSLLYLLTTVPLTLYVSFSHRRCLFSASPLLPFPLFSYPSSYGERKHALSASHSCSSPVFFSDYQVVFEEIQNICRNRSLSPRNSNSPVLSYVVGKGETFAGNYSTEKRKSFFDQSGDDRVPVPCGFLRDFLVEKSDVPDTALIVRRHGMTSHLFSCLLFNELEAFNPRDQLAFAYVRDMMSPRIKINMFEFEVFEQVAVEYRHNLKREGGLPAAAEKPLRRAALVGFKGSKCRNYLLQMWGEVVDDDGGG